MHLPQILVLSTSRDGAGTSNLPSKPLRTHGRFRFALACVRRIPIVHLRAPAALADTSKAKASASWCGPSPRAASDSSTGRCDSVRDRGGGGSSTCTSCFESSENGSGHGGGGKWRIVSGTATRDEKVRGHSYRLICAKGRVDGADDAAQGGGSGVGSRMCPAAAGERDGEDGEEGDSGNDSSSRRSSSTGSTSSDGIGESASVEDITDCLECISQASGAMKRGGKEVKR